MVERLKDPEFLKAAPYFAVGAVQGAIEYYVKPAMTAERGWMLLGAGVLAWDYVAHDQETLSQGANRAFDANRLAVGSLIAYTGAHLMGILPEKADLFKQGLRAIKG